VDKDLDKKLIQILKKLKYFDYKVSYKGLIFRIGNFSNKDPKYSIELEYGDTKIMYEDSFLDNTPDYIKHKVIMMAEELLKEQIQFMLERLKEWSKGNKLQGEK
jgi:hypothetical protein